MAGYRLEAQLGAGGMAVVFRARDERLGRLVALKMLAPALAADPAFRRRFIAESRAAAVVDNPHIIPVFEAGESGGVLFIAMRFVAGGDLREVLDREGPLPPGRAAGFISPVASALDAAHRAGLVHRDVKPANILVDADADRPDHVYLSDFGVSKGAVSSVSLTGAGHFLGTPDYSAPEQIQGWAVDGRVDQYALACVAFQLLTGTAPFERDQGMAVLLAHLSEPPPPLSSRRPGLPAAADQVLARAMAKVPEKRYGSCREFADALRDALGVMPYAYPRIAAPGHTPAQADAPPSGFTAPVPAAAAGTAGLPGPAADRTVDAVPGSWQAGTAEVSREDPVAARRREDPSGPGPGPVTGRHAAREAVLRQPAAAMARPAGPTGRRRSFRLGVAATLAAALAVAAGLSVLALHDGGTGTHSSVTDSPGTRVSPHTEPPIPNGIAALTDPGSAGVQSVAFSPNGTTLAVGDTDGSAYVWNLATRTLTARLRAPGHRSVDSVAFSPNGTILATGDYNGSTYLWNLATGTITATLTDPGGTSSSVAGGGHGVNSVAFSPNGSALAAGDVDGSTYLWNLATHALTATLADPGSNAGQGGVDSVTFSPNGTSLATSDYYNGDRIFLWSLATRAISATLTDPAGRSGPNSGTTSVFSVAFGPDGTTLAAGDEDGRTYLWNVATRTITATLTRHGSNRVFSVAFSPDGTTLAAGYEDGRTYLWNLATRAITAILTDPAGNSGAHPPGASSEAFSPDGTILATGDYDGSTYLRNAPGRASP